jgi:hypothetical protein
MIMVDERKQQMHDKYLKDPPRWILATVKRDWNLSDLTGNPCLDELHDFHDTALAYWGQNHW